MDVENVHYFYEKNKNKIMEEEPTFEGEDDLCKPQCLRNIFETNCHPMVESNKEVHR